MNDEARDTETAREIVKRFGVKIGMFQGPRTLNAVEAIAQAISSARQDEKKACVEKVKAKALEYQQARDDAYAGEPRCDAVGENEIRQAVAVELATILDSAKCATTPPDTPVVARELFSRLIKLAAAVIAGHDFISPYADDNPKTTPQTILVQAEKQRERLRLWAIEIRAIADKLSAAIITRHLAATGSHEIKAAASEGER